MSAGILPHLPQRAARRLAFRRRPRTRHYPTDSWAPYRSAGRGHRLSAVHPLAARADADGSGAGAPAYAENLAATAAALMRAASGEVGKIEGTVRISASDIIGVEMLPPIIAAMQEIHPRLEIELSLSDTLEDLLRREADIAIRMTEPQQDAIVMRYIGNFRLGFHATRDYLARAGTPKTWKN